MPELRLISAPFHDGVPGVGMGAGAALLAGDELLRDLLAGAGWTLSLIQKYEPTRRVVISYGVLCL
jgi:hypothetical protein